ncbi:hypothetical protein Lal_00005933 [Lupinus albus]|nr:hypothetical protein Lal_00005933 [Lupinus albus]
MDFKVSHIFIEGNACADRLASFGLNSRVDNWWGNPPNFLFDVLQRNMLSLPNYRFRDVWRSLYALWLHGYADFGDEAPGNLLTGFGFYDPYWLVDIANVAIVVHLVGTYQVFAQFIFAFVQKFVPLIKSY